MQIVDIFQQPTPLDVTINLGERVSAYQNGQDDSALVPSPVDEISGGTFYYQQSDPDTGDLTLYATRETKNLNDFQVHWLQAGVAGAGSGRSSLTGINWSGRTTWRCTASICARW